MQITRAPTLDPLQHWLDGSEDEHLECKEAKTQFDSEKLTRYCVALANEGGGRVIFGVTDKRPRKVVGTQAFQDLSSLKRNLSQRVRLHIDATVFEHPDGRILTEMKKAGLVHALGKNRGARWYPRPSRQEEGGE